MTRFPIAREGLGLIIPALVLFLLFAWLGFLATATFCLVLFFFFVYFFRNPQRSCLCGPDELISPADGKVMSIETHDEDLFLKAKARRISIFMSPTDVHVNRAPCEGEVLHVEHRKGRFRMAFKEEVDRENERNYLLYGRGEERFLIVQIAGFLARRIFCYVKKGDPLQKGQPFGMIGLGSRVDLYVPEHYEPAVQLSQKVKAGLTVVARARGKE